MHRLAIASLGNAQLAQAQAASFLEPVETSSCTMRVESVAAVAHHVRANTNVDQAMDRYANGDDAAFADVYDGIAPRVHGFILRQTRDRVQADDLLQQTLLQIHRKRDTYITGSPVLPWAIAIARRLYIDTLRRRKQDALSSARAVADTDGIAEASPDDELQTRETAWLVEAELAKMPETHRTAFELLRIDGLSQVEAAAILGTTVTAVKLRAFRAYQAIRAALGRSANQRPDEPLPSSTSLTNACHSESHSCRFENPNH